jgi:hypothetical protein
MRCDGYQFFQSSVVFLSLSDSHTTPHHTACTKNQFQLIDISRCLDHSSLSLTSQRVGLVKFSMWTALAVCTHAQFTVHLCAALLNRYHTGVPEKMKTMSPFRLPLLAH